MGVTIIVGAQFGSEGKGKVAREFARRFGACAVARVGGSNSGHTVFDERGCRRVLRVLPAAAIDGAAISVLPPGSYVDLAQFRKEIRIPGVDRSRILIDPNAAVILPEHAEEERAIGLRRRIGSTLSGTGVAAARRVLRDPGVRLARDVPELSPYLGDTASFFDERLHGGEEPEEILVEGTQGFGLSNLHSPYYPMATSRDTTASGFAMECGLSPRDVNRVIMTIRAFPIRVAGNSGELPKETSWRR